MENGIISVSGGREGEGRLNLYRIVSGYQTNDMHSIFEMAGWS